MRTRNVTRTLKVVETIATFVNTVTNEFVRKTVNIPFCYYKTEKDRKKFFDSVAPVDCIYVNCVEQKRTILLFSMPENEYLSRAKVKKEVAEEFDTFDDDDSIEDEDEETEN